MRERAGERAARYLETTSRSLQMKSDAPVPTSRLDHMLELARGYTQDAKHYLNKRKPVTALACIAYAEGLLDALKFLELAEF